MARNKAEPVVLAPDVPLDEDALNTARDVMAAVQGGYSEERDLLNQLLGQAQMADAFAQFSVTVTTSKLSFVKENKLYRALKGQKSRHGDEFLTGTWAEFCGLLGRSVEQIDRDIANLKSFGEDALESMSRMGIGYRELRQYRRLPEDQKLALIEAAKSGDKESFVDLAEEIITKHAREKEELNKKLDETTANYEAQAQVLSDKNSLVDAKERELRKIKRRVAETPADEAALELRQEVTGYAFSAEIAVRGDLASGIQTLLSHQFDAGSDDTRRFAASLLVQVEAAINDIRAEHGLPARIDSNPTPDWRRSDAEGRVRDAVTESRSET